MKIVKMPDLLTSETIDAVSANSEVLMDLINSGSERMELTQVDCCHEDRCCCPKFIKFKFVLCNTTIINNNAACHDN